ncbi:outer membrane transport energization protein ExbD [Ectothiorhodosinus mongolicus]|uniref:Outer membrane transport energization protein ExbD n=1 Tax=Ectothiorhodosinus mongolicus TaxID=233100 RepID=A0A1R3VMP3_9GAMM|nr:biopolymer transporter ExbD [Ectothiorhodosinus mongolicus]ULX56338.1 biopolymer transporter ExbD [Ectothiorhodosinus mongolicus]SIT65851.1 outer membrane transport energization protein ExbD [Ectothiorhodosinus mongolicus]
MIRLSEAVTARHDDNQMIPLINIVFLLLIFFMVAGVLEAQNILNVDPPDSVVTQASDERDILVLLDAQGQTALDETIVPLDSLTEAVRTRITALGGETDALRVHIKADASVTTEQLLMLMDHLRDAGIQRITLLAVVGNGL